MEDKIIDLAKTTTAYKSGRAFNDAERDRGTAIHIVPKMPENARGFWGYKALCGTRPGQRGNGWKEANQESTCENCLKKWGKLITFNK